MLERDERILLEKIERAVLTQKIEELQQRVYNLRSEMMSHEISLNPSLHGKDMELRAQEIKRIAELELELSKLAQRAKSESENKQMQLCGG